MSMGGWPDGWTLAHGDLGGLWGLTDWSTRTIWLDRRLRQVEARATLAHELEHVRRGRLPADRRLAAREEAEVEQAAARKLIGLHALGDALAWARCLAEAADELGVDEPLLATRLEHLHPSERAWLRDRVARRVEGA